MSPHFRERIIDFWHWILDAGVKRSKSKQARIDQVRHDAKMNRINRDAMRARRDAKERSARRAADLTPPPAPQLPMVPPFQPGQPPPMIVYMQSPPNVQKIEKTGKVFKGQMALAVLLLLIGIGGCSANMATNPGAGAGFAWLAILSFIYYLMVKIAAWWHHG